MQRVANQVSRAAINDENATALTDLQRQRGSGSRSRRIANSSRGTILRRAASCFGATHPLASSSELWNNAAAI